MIRAYYTQATAQIMNSVEWTAVVQCLLPQLSAGRRDRLERIRHDQTRLNSALGLLLLQHAQRTNGHADFVPAELEHNDRVKPACPGRHPFNISHSREVVLCAVNTASASGVGADVEFVREVNEPQFADYIGPEDLAVARRQPGSQRSAFMFCWTQKEAVIKAEGNGGVWDMPKVILHGREADYLGRRWYLLPLAMPDGYFAHVASADPGLQLAAEFIPCERVLADFMTRA